MPKRKLKRKDMKQTIIAATIFLLVAFDLSAQKKVDFGIKNENEFSLSLSAGYAYIDGIAGLSNYANRYNNKMRFGFDYNFQFEYRKSRFTAGVIASVFNSNGSAEFSSDDIFINNFAVQAGAYWLLPELHKFSLKTAAGLGLCTYTNNSKVFGRKRYISENAFSIHTHHEVAYKLSPNWAIALNVLLTWSEKWAFDVNYHDETFVVEQYLPLSKISASIGIKYTF